MKSLIVLFFCLSSLIATSHDSNPNSRPSTIKIPKHTIAHQETPEQAFVRSMRRPSASSRWSSTYSSMQQSWTTWRNAYRTVKNRHDMGGIAELINHMTMGLESMTQCRKLVRKLINDIDIAGQTQNKALLSQIRGKSLEFLRDTLEVLYQEASGSLEKFSQQHPTASQEAILLRKAAEEVRLQITEINEEIAFFEKMKP